MKWIKKFLNKPAVSSVQMAVYGFDQRSTETLRMAFDGPGKGCGMLVDESAAEASIFNMDCVNAAELWAGYRRRFPNRPTIVVSIKDPEFKDAIYVPKPIRMEALIGAVGEIRNLLSPEDEMPDPIDLANALEKQAPPAQKPVAPKVQPKAAAPKAAPPKPASESAAVHRSDKLSSVVGQAVEKARMESMAAQRATELKFEKPASAKPAQVATPQGDVEEIVLETVNAARDFDVVTEPKRPSAAATARSSGAAQAQRRPAAMAKKPGETYYDPQDHFQGQLQTGWNIANSKSVIVQLKVLTADEEWRDVMFFPGVRRVYSSLNDEQLKQLCSTPLYLVTHSMHKRNDDEALEIQRTVATENAGTTLDTFMWKVALWTSVGRLPSGTDVKAPVSLKHWPNFTRVSAIPNAMRIATLLIDQPRPLGLVVKVLNIPQSHVFAFYSAALAAGLVSSDARSAPVQTETVKQERHRHHSLFGRILNRLRGD